MNNISYEERVKVYNKAADAYGADMQLVVALEELSEVQKEICKMLRNKGSLEHLAEEVADATIVLEQVRNIFFINDRVCEYMDAKVTRLNDRVTRQAHKKQGV